MTDPLRPIRYLVGSVNAVATLYGLGYGLLVGQTESLGMAPPRILLAFAAVGLFIALPLGGVWSRRYGASIARVLRGEAVTPGERLDAQRRALELPVRITRASTVIWMLCAALYPLFPYAAGLDPWGFGTWHVMLATVLISTISGATVYYVEERYVRAELIPALFPEGRLAQTPGVDPVTLELKFLVLLMSTVVLPIVVLTVAARTQALTPAVVLYLAVGFFLFGVEQAYFISQSIDGPVEALGDAMRRVTQNDLQARAPVLAIDSIGELAEGFNGMVAGLRRAEFVRDTFGRYVSPAVVAEVLEGKVALGGELRTATVLFSDIRDFTALTEKMSPAEVVGFLNSYLEGMVQVVVAEGGSVDKFIGDAVMATFGVPVSRGDDALRAVRAAVGMLERLAAWNAEREKDGKPPLKIGIGLHTGEVLAGNIGSTRKMEYTVIGDTVNTASRIESLNKALRTQLLISAQTYAEVRAAVVARALEPVEVKGKSEKLQVYEVTGLAGR